jgi:pimeloyl-ACP methyl ester carboxylesterase
VVDRRGQVVTMLDRCYLTEGMPTLLVWGEHDRVLPVRHAYLAHACMPGSNTEPAAYEQGHWRDLLLAGRPGPANTTCGS